MSLIQVYAPTKDRSQDVNDEFYAKLQDSGMKVPADCGRASDCQGGQ